MAYEITQINNKLHPVVQIHHSDIEVVGNHVK